MRKYKITSHDQDRICRVKEIDGPDYGGFTSMQSNWPPVGATVEIHNLGARDCKVYYDGAPIGPYPFMEDT
jgi:hypothetical protein